MKGEASRLDIGRRRVRDEGFRNYCLVQPLRFQHRTVLAQFTIPPHSTQLSGGNSAATSGWKLTSLFIIYYLKPWKLKSPKFLFSPNSIGKYFIFELIFFWFRKFLIFSFFFFFLLHINLSENLDLQSDFISDVFQNSYVLIYL